MQVVQCAFRTWHENVGQAKSNMALLNSALQYFSTSRLRGSFNAWRLAVGHAFGRRAIMLQIAARFLSRTMAKVCDGCII